MPLNMKHLFILLICSLEISLAVAVVDPTNQENVGFTMPLNGANITHQYENLAEWDWFDSFSIPEHPDALASSVHSKELESLQFSVNDLFVREEGEGGIQFPKFNLSTYSYLPEIEKEGSGMNELLSRSTTRTSSPELQHIYKNNKTQQWLLDYSSSIGTLEESNVAYGDSEIVDKSVAKIGDIEALKTESEGMFGTGYSSDLQLLMPERISQLYETSLKVPHNVGLIPASGGNDQTLNHFSGSFDPQTTDELSSTGYSYIPETLPSPRNKKELKNYAIVVGIDEYKDRMSLHTCANDARSMADLMEEMGYDVVLLSDKTNDKPTKENILNKAFEEIRDKQNVGNVIFYFSGHGVKTKSEMFYLIPQNANGNVTTYISESEIKEKITSLKNFAMIIDACNSEGLSPAIGDGQLIIASSMYNESSNGEWTGSMSVFTSYLIKAIRGEKEKSNRVLLQRCFERAQIDTVRWSQDHLIQQTPVILDNTGGIYYIN